MARSFHVQTVIATIFDSFLVLLMNGNDYMDAVVDWGRNLGIFIAAPPPGGGVFFHPSQH